MKQYLLLALFISLMADLMFGWGLGIAPGLSLKNAMLYLIILMMMVEFGASPRKATVELPAIHVLFGLLFLIALLSWASQALLGVNPHYNAFAGLIALKGRLLDHYLFFLVFFLGLRSESDVSWLQRWFLLVVAASSIVTVLDAYNLPDLNVISTKDGRVAGPLGEPNQYGLFVAMFLPVLAAQGWIERGPWRVVFTMGAAATFWVLLLTVSRGAFVAMMFGALLTSWLLRRHITKTLLVRIVAVSVLAAIGAMLLVGQDYLALIQERTTAGGAEGNAYDITSGRTWIWSNAFGLMMRSPWTFLTGSGWDTVRTALGIAPHSVYIGYLFELGLPGLLAFVALLATVALAAVRALNHAAGNALSPIIGGFVFGFVVLAVGIAAVDLADAWYFIWAYAGLALRIAVLAAHATPSAPGVPEMFSLATRQ